MQRLTPRARICLAGLGAALVGLVVLIVLLTGGGPQRAQLVSGTELGGSVIYHSPQSPGYTAWVGAWTMPDGSLMTAFDQATGPVDPARRQLMPEPTLERDFGYTEDRAKSPPYTYLDPHYDFWGLHQEVVYLRSPDGGRSWHLWHTDHYHSLQPQAYTAQADAAFADGTLIRRVSGLDLPNDPSIPHEAVLETLRFDPATSRPESGWSPPQAILHDPSICTYQISRVHELRDGRVIATGGVQRFASGDSGRCAPNTFSYLLMVAGSVQAAEHGQWRLGMPFTTQVNPNEWDVAELPDGNLLALMRTTVDGHAGRLQAILQRTSSGWVMGAPSHLPALAAFAPSGHPDLLATSLGAVISFSTTGTAYTTNGGATWHTLTFSGRPGYDFSSDYYPYAVQARNGEIYVFSHAGYDIPYGAFNEAIVMDHFRLRSGPAS